MSASKGPRTGWCSVAAFCKGVCICLPLSLTPVCSEGIWDCWDWATFKRDFLVAGAAGGGRENGCQVGTLWGFQLLSLPLREGLVDPVLTPEASGDHRSSAQLLRVPGWTRVDPHPTCTHTFAGR